MSEPRDSFIREMKEMDERNDYARGCRFVSDGEFQGIVCTHIGVSSTTDVVTRKNDDGTWHARVGISVFGFSNMMDLIEECPNPFHPMFPDNFCEGKGGTEKEALEALVKDMQELSRSMV